MVDVIAVVEDGETLDLAAAACLHAACFEDAWPEEWLRCLATTPEVIAATATAADGHLAGFGLARIAGKEAEILTLAVAPARRGGGLGGRMLERLLERACARGARAVFLEVAVDNPAALDLYRRHGFAEVGRRKSYYERAGDRTADAIVMRRALDDQPLRMRRR